METSKTTIKRHPKKANDFIWLILGIAGLILALLVLKYFMHSIKLV